MAAAVTDATRSGATRFLPAVRPAPSAYRSPPMDLNGTGTAAPEASELLSTTETRLRGRQAELAPLLAEYDRVQQLTELLERTPEDAVGPSDVAAHPAHAEVLEDLERVRAQLLEWSARLAPLVREHEQIAHVLTAFEAASTIESDALAGRRRRRPSRVRVNGGASATREARTDQLKALLQEPRSRSDIAEQLQLSASRVTELLEPLVRAGEITEIRDPERPTRKLWALADRPRPAGDEASDGV